VFKHSLTACRKTLQAVFILKSNPNDNTIDESDLEVFVDYWLVGTD